ncbi:hypothetical protein Nepgr_003986 [Nepenthes gracilis]|uniref:Uncharacterized protein n=1 Tax=Nepenthes gracilis TaxID=150966 RepID=A0AAD3S0K1_NEPGR|nr:hypothetical protein Nepgr_003986 [Nepenthes gracilis]
MWVYDVGCPFAAEAALVAVGSLERRFCPVTASGVGGSAAYEVAHCWFLAISSSLLWLIRCPCDGLSVLMWLPSLLVVTLVVCPCWLNSMLVFGVGVMQLPVAPAGGILGFCLPFVAAFGCCPAAGGVEFWPYAVGCHFCCWCHMLVGVGFATNDLTCVSLPQLLLKVDRALAVAGFNGVPLVIAEPILCSMLICCCVRCSRFVDMPSAGMLVDALDLMLLLLWGWAVYLATGQLLKVIAPSLIETAVWLLRACVVDRLSAVMLAVALDTMLLLLWGSAVLLMRSAVEVQVVALDAEDERLGGSLYCLLGYGLLFQWVCLVVCAAEALDALVSRSPGVSLAPSLSASSGGLVSSDVGSGSVMVGPECVKYDAPPAKSDIVKPSNVSWSRVVQVEPGVTLPDKIRLKTSTSEGADLELSTEVTIEYQWKLVRCSTCRTVGHSYCQTKKKKTEGVYGHRQDATDHLVSAWSYYKEPIITKEVVKAIFAAMSTSNSFEILPVKDDLSHLGKSATQIAVHSAVEVLDGREHHDAGNSRAEPASPGSSHYNVSDEVIVTNKDSSASQPSQICQDESGCKYV